MPFKQFEVVDIGPVSVYKRRNARSIRITIKPGGGVRVSQPVWLPYKAGLEYAKTKKDWIKQHTKVQIKLLNNKKIGKYHRLYFVKSGSSNVTVRVNQTEIRVNYPLNMSIQSTTVQNKAIAGCERALRLEAETLLPQRLNQLASKYGYNHNGVSIKKLRSRWGSCDHQHRIALNLYLMLLPWQLIDYVLLHELNHTRHLNHSQQFWIEIEKNMPNAKTLRRQLRAHQPTF